MLDSDAASPGLLGSLRRLLDASLAALQNRAEILALEFEEEKDRAIELAIRVVAVLFFAILSVLVLTAGIILIFPDHLRAYVAFGFAFLYALGGAWAAAGLRSRLKN